MTDAGMTAAEPVIRWQDVSFSYATKDSETVAEAVPSLHQISAEVSRGECVIVCGPSGGGKSSLLRTVNGLIPQFHHGALTGEVQVCGQPVSNQPLHRTAQLVSTVFQNPRSQFFTTEVATELAFGGENGGRDPEQLRRAIDRAADVVGIRQLLHRSPETLSGGEKQLVACAGSLVDEPQVQCFDEPTANLSPAAIDAFTAHLHRLRDRGQTMVITEHRLHFLREIADRVLVIEGGRISHSLPAQEFFRLGTAEREALGLRTLTPPTLPDLPLIEVQDAADERTGPGLTLTGLEVRRGGRSLIRLDRLHLPAGAVHAVMGPNGAGKSTLAYALCGLLKTQHGRIAIDGTELSRRQRRTRIGLVMQETHRQLFTSSVAEELAGGPRHHDTPQLNDPAISETLRRFGLDQLADRHPLSLSGGQMQRLAIAQVTCPAPGEQRPVVILDEPTSGLDLTQMQVTAQTLRGLADSAHTVLVITHDLELVAACADSILHLSPRDSPGPARN